MRDHQELEEHVSERKNATFLLWCQQCSQGCLGKPDTCVPCGSRTPKQAQNSLTWGPAQVQTVHLSENWLSFPRMSRPAKGYQCRASLMAENVTGNKAAHGLHVALPVWAGPRETRVLRTDREKQSKLKQPTGNPLLRPVSTHLASNPAVRVWLGFYSSPWGERVVRSPVGDPSPRKSPQSCMVWRLGGGSTKCPKAVCPVEPYAGMASPGYHEEHWFVKHKHWYYTTKKWRDHLG